MTLLRQLIRVNPSLKNKLIKELLTYSLSQKIIIDEDLYPQTLMAQVSDAENILRDFDKAYFRPSKQATIIQDDTYRKYYQKKKTTVLCVGDTVTLILDGKAYVITQMDAATDVYTIVEKEKRLTTISVPGVILKKR